MVVQQVPKPMNSIRVVWSVSEDMNGTAAGAKTDERRKSGLVC